MRKLNILKKKNNKMIVQIIIAIGLIYLLFGAFLFFNQQNMIYYPSKIDFLKCDNFQGYMKYDMDGTRFYHNHRSENDVVIYFHGNAGSACDRTKIKEILEKTQKSLIFVEYTGYSIENEEPTKEAILNNANIITGFIKQKGYQELILIGESIGNGPAAYMASNIKEVNRIIAMSSFTSIVDIAKKTYWMYPLQFMIKENYDNKEWLKEYNESIMIIHGTKDKIIPINNAKELFESLSTTKKHFLEIEEGNHNNLLSFNQTEDIILQYINREL